MIQAAKLKKVAGAANVMDDAAVLKSFAGDCSFVHPVMPQYVVKVHNTDDVQKLVKLARETATPLVPVSSGPPHFRGDTVPGTGETVIVDLSGMKKIIMVDRKNRSTMFEAGVTFSELSKAVAKKGLRLNLPLLPRATKSVVGSLLEREPVIMPKYHWDIGDPTNCFEVVFGTGDVFRTGAAAGPGTIEEQWKAGGAQKEAAGPSSSSWYRIIQGAQGTMGIVSWATARCELIPSMEEPFLCGAVQLDKLLELTHWLIRLRLANECFILNRTDMASIMADKWPADYHRYQNQLPPWVLFFDIAAYEYLPEMRIKGQVEDMIGLTEKVGLEAVKEISGITAGDILKKVQSPSAGAYWKMKNKGSYQDVMFLAMNENLSSLTEVMQKVVEEAGYPQSELGIYIQPLVQGSNWHCEFTLFFDPSNKSEASRIKELCARAIPALMDKGAFFSRPYGENVALIMNRDAATVAALHKVKSILDPDKILNPGKLCF